MVVAKVEPDLIQESLFPHYIKGQGGDGNTLPLQITFAIFWKTE